MHTINIIDQITDETDDMSRFIKIVSILVLMVAPSLLLADQLGRHVAIEPIVVNDTRTVPAGAEVNFLGVIDVSLNTAPSGRLATFTYGGQVYNADASLFYAQSSDPNVTTYPARTFESGASVSMCSTFVQRVHGEILDFANDGYQKHFELTSDGRVIDAYAITSPTDIYSRQDERREFCITGLSHSTNYQLRLLPGLTLLRTNYEVSLDIPIFMAFKTPARTPSIRLDSSKSILTDATNAFIPIEYTNVTELEVTLHKVDLASLPAYSDVFALLNGAEIDQLGNFWANEIAKKTVQLEAPLDQTQNLNLNFSDLLERDAEGLFVATFTSPQIDSSRYKKRPTQWFSISNIAMQFYKGLNQSDIFLSSFSDATAVADANVRVIAANNRTLFEGRSDQSGHVEIPNNFLNGSSGFAPKFILVSGASYGTSIIQVDGIDQKPRFLDGGAVKREQTDVYLTSDRGIYRPGETIELVGVARGLDLTPMPAEELIVKLVNRQNNQVYSMDLSSNDFGAFAAQIPLKSTIPLGRYSIRVTTVDEVILAEHAVNISDFVPLTIEAGLEMKDDAWPVGAEQDITLTGSYFSGGAASGLSAEITTSLQEVSSHDEGYLSGFIFGNEANSLTSEVDSFTGVLGDSGEFATSFMVDYQFEKDRLYDVVVEGTVYDVGGRANIVKKRVGLDTLPSYVGVRSEFGDYASRDFPPSFTIASVDRQGTPVAFEGVSYTVNKVKYRYNWYYSRGWRWNAVRVSSDTVEAGEVTGDTLTLRTPLSWGRHEIVVKNNHGFETTYEFYVGWGSDTKPSNEPEQLSFSFDGTFVRGTAPFSGVLSILVANEDIQKVVRTEVQQGEFELPFGLADEGEPGVHLLASLVRPIETGSEHLPQIALGKTWVSNVKANRTLEVVVSAPTKADSQTPLDVTINTDASGGSAMIFVVDEGIHAISGYTNDDITEHFLSERALNYGIFTNFGKLVSQDETLRSIRVGGDGDMLSSAAQAPKSEFFKTFVAASPLLSIIDGEASFSFDRTNEWEGRLRVVVVAVGATGFGFSETEITVQDPVSIDVSVPRFVAPNDRVNAKMNVRWNEFSGPVELRTTIGTSTNIQNIEVPTSNQFALDLPIKTPAVGTLPVHIEVTAGERVYRRTYEIVSRNASYPITEIQSVELQKRNWLGFGGSLVQPYSADLVELDAPGSIYSASLTNIAGINLSQAVSELNRYPYGCVEQVSSKARGLLALTEVRGLSEETAKKIQLGIDNLLAKQKISGAFGYWSANSRVYEVYQPYAVDTLQKLLPYADNPDQVITAINNGLEYMYRSNFADQRTKLYAYGILARSGYEVTSRARYTIDRILSQQRSELLPANASPRLLANALDDFALAYWTAANLSDTKRMMQVSEKVRYFLNQSPVIETLASKSSGAWFSGGRTEGFGARLSVAAPEYAHLLTEIERDSLAPALSEVVVNTHKYLSQRRYRSTQSSAKLVALQKYQEQSMEGTKVSIDGMRFVLDETGSIPLTEHQLKTGFDIGHDASTSLFLNVKTTGQRSFTDPLNNGYRVTKRWYDRSGNAVDLESGRLDANQGDLFTVVIRIDRTQAGQGSDLLLTDLLPTGFEIEDATLAAPQVKGNEVDLSGGATPFFTAAIDDRFIAHFDGRWYRNDYAFVRYTVRAAYRGKAQIPDATVEEMYAPEINGRSGIARAVVKGR